MVDIAEHRAVLSLSWQDVDQLTTSLAERVTREGLPDVIIGLERGGLIPAVALSHLLEVRSLLPLPVQSTTSDAVYAEKKAPFVDLERCTHALLQDRDVLVVDDIVGTGQTLSTVLRVLTNYRPARLRSAVYLVNRAHWNTSQQGEPAQCISYIGQEVRGWVVFPWEKKECND